jgi:hypothetical protein
MDFSLIRGRGSAGRRALRAAREIKRAGDTELCMTRLGCLLGPINGVANGSDEFLVALLRISAALANQEISKLPDDSHTFEQFDRTDVGEIQFFCRHG